MKKGNEDERLLEEKSIGEKMLEAGSDVAAIMSYINGIIGPGNIISKALKYLEHLIRK